MPERWRYRASVLFRRAGCHVSDDYYYKPKWMRWATFNRLIDEAEEFENASFGYRMLAFLRMAKRHALAT